MLDLWATEQEADLIRTGWSVSDVLFSGKSEFQTVDVVNTKAYGKMLLLDGLVMITDADEFVYHEMISHVPVCLHKSPKKVVVIGGGDGGTVRELLKYPEIEEIILCEIDELVIEASRRFFPEVSSCLFQNNPKVKVKVGDGVAFVKELKNEIDIVLIDSTDPIGPGEGLFSSQFYRDVASALKPGGVMAAQSESPWFDRESLIRIHRNIAAGFSFQQSMIAPIPTYPRGTWSWTVASQESIHSKRFDLNRFKKVESSLKYLNIGTLQGVFDIPK
ncbi:MAG: polyamine aminopropyltransferase, partial [Proteobacteria bacterium]|nr:polyamine aminopropyltransferase [Pseudomonadota bacterium]